jgi:hypothetical protein
MAETCRWSVSWFLLVSLASFAAHTTAAQANELSLDDFVKLCVETQGDKAAISRAIVAMTPPYVPGTRLRYTQEWTQEITKRHLVVVNDQGLVESCMLSAGLDNVEGMARIIQVRFAPSASPTRKNGSVQFDDVSVSHRMTAGFGLMEGLFIAHAQPKPATN